MTSNTRLWAVRGPIGITATLYGLPGLVLGPWFGRLADRNDAVSALMFSYAARAATSMLLFLAPDVTVFVFLVLIKGIGNLGVMPSEQILVRSML